MSMQSSATATEKPSSSLRSKKQALKHLLSILLIACLSIVLYASAIKNGFVYDDNNTIVNNSLINDFSNLPKLFQIDYFAGSGELTYRPVVTFTYFTDFALFGLSPWGFHLTNILLHAVNGIMVYAFLTLLAKESEALYPSNKIPLIGSILFVSHPVLTEAVNAVSFREDLLTSLFYMATLNIYLFLRHYKTFSYSLLFAASCLLYFLALLSKEMALTLPLIVFCYEWIYEEKKDRSLYTILFNTGYIAVTLAYVYLRFFYFQNPIIVEPTSWDLMERFLTIPWLLIHSFKLTLFPVLLSAYYEAAPVKSIFSTMFIIPLIALIAFLVLSITMRKRGKGESFGILFFIITLIPVYNIIPLNHPFTERYLYLPSVGLIIVAASLVHSLFKTQGFKILILLFIIVGVNSLSTAARTKVWKDDFSLWSDTVRKMPNSGRPHHYLGYAYYTQNRFDDAIDEYRMAIELKPDLADAHNNLGNLYDIQGHLDDAIKEYSTALKLNPNDAITHYNLGLVLYKQGRLEMAEIEYLTAIKLRDDYAEAYNNLGNLYDSQGRLDEATVTYITAIKLKPDYLAAHYNLGLAFYRKERLDDAIKEFIAALKLNPNDADTHYAMGNAYMAKGLKNEARREFEITLMLRPESLPANQAVKSLNSSSLP